VGYGRVLQEFLAKYVPIKAIYDNQAKRSFAHASVNTVIVLLGNPNILDKKNPTPTCLEHIAKFVIFKKPFEEVISYKNMITIYNFSPDKYNLFGNTYKDKDDKFRIYAISQKELLKEGIEKKKGGTETFQNQITGEYKGSKWGGKYLRAPDIFFTILEKGKDKLVRLGDIAEVRRGFTTGANEFFYVEDVTEKIDFIKIKHQIKNLGEIDSLDEIKKYNLRIIYNKKYDSYWLIEKEYLFPIIKSLKEVSQLIINNERFKFNVFFVKDKVNKNKFAYEYIKWGEMNNINLKPTCSNRCPWYKIPNIKGEYLFNMSSGDRYLIPYNYKNFFIDARLYGITLKEKIDSHIILIILNSSYLPIYYEINGREMTGNLPLLDLKVYELKDAMILNPNLILKEKAIEVIEKLNNRKIYSIFIELGFNTEKPIREQEPNPLPDRKALDDIIFDVLGLTKDERKEVYWATAELVKNRLDKARSFKK